MLCNRNFYVVVVPLERTSRSVKNLKNPDDMDMEEVRYLKSKCTGPFGRKIYDINCAFLIGVSFKVKKTKFLLRCWQNRVFPRRDSRDTCLCNDSCMGKLYCAHRVSGTGTHKHKHKYISAMLIQAPQACSRERITQSSPTLIILP